MRKHTPTPWVADFEYTDAGSKARVFRNAQFQYALTEYGTMSDEDAAYIVRAVNAHEGLVSALAAVLRRLESEGPDFLTGSQEIIRAALSAAKE